MVEEVCKGCSFSGCKDTIRSKKKKADVLFILSSPEELSMYLPILKPYLITLFSKKLSYETTFAVKCYNNKENSIKINKKTIVKCSYYLKKEIEYIEPKLIVCLGKIALCAILQELRGVSKLNGRIIDFEDKKLAVCVSPEILYEKEATVKETNLKTFEKGILPVLKYFDEQEVIECIDVDSIRVTEEEVGFDIETTALLPVDGIIRCFSVSNGKKALFVDLEQED